MQAIIVAAGEGNRLRPLTEDRPKALLEIQGKSLIRRSLEQLLKAGISDVAIVLGYRKEMIIQHLSDLPVTFFYNPLYRITNNMASLWFARTFVTEEFLYLHSDLIYDERLLAHLVASRHPNTLLVEHKSCNPEDMKVKVQGEHLVASSKEITLAEAFGEWTGHAKFDQALGTLLFDKIGKLIEQGYPNAYDTMAFTELVKDGHPIHVAAFTDWPWVEIDTFEDLQEARRLFEGE